MKTALQLLLLLVSQALAFTTAECKGSRITGTSYGHRHYRNITTTTADACCSACAADAKSSCAGWTYFKTSGQCMLKTPALIHNATANPECVSGKLASPSPPALFPVDSL